MPWILLTSRCGCAIGRRSAEAQPSQRMVPACPTGSVSSASVASREPITLIRVVVDAKHRHEKEPTEPAMPAFGWQLTDAKIAAVTTYIGNSWHHAAPIVIEHQVHDAREMLA